MHEIATFNHNCFITKTFLPPSLIHVYKLIGIDNKPSSVWLIIGWWSLLLYSQDGTLGTLSAVYVAILFSVSAVMQLK